MEGGTVIAVSRSAEHHFSKPNVPSIQLLKGLGVEDDAHCGTTVKHRSRVAKDPTQPNLRQVHLIQSELFDQLRSKGFDISPGAIGENITTRGIDLLGLPTGTRLHVGDAAVVEITGLRNPCYQIENFKKGLLGKVLVREDGKLVRKGGIMGVVVEGGVISPEASIRVELPRLPHRPLEMV